MDGSKVLEENLNNTYDQRNLWDRCTGNSIV